MSRQNKFKNKRVSVDGLSFDSKKEANRWGELQLMQRAGEIHSLERQVRFPLCGMRGTVICHYVADFVYFTKSGKKVVEDVKSEATKTPIYNRNKKWLKADHDIEIYET